MRQNSKLKNLVLILSLSAIFWSTPAKSACDEDDPASCAVPLEKGAKAPYSGQLLTPKLALKLGQGVNTCKLRADLEMAKVLDIHQARVDYTLRAHVAEIDGYRRQMELLKEEAKVPWWRHPAFVATAATIGTGMAFFGIFHLAKSVESAP